MPTLDLVSVLASLHSNAMAMSHSSLTVTTALLLLVADVPMLESVVWEKSFQVAHYDTGTL